MFTYLLIDLGIIFFPLIFSVNSKIKFVKFFKPVIQTILFTALIFIGWDILATHAGHWKFNDTKVIPVRIINLPLEEILFFITVPFSLTFFYQALETYIPKKINFNFNLLGLVTVISVIFAFLFYTKIYSLVAAISCLLSIIVTKYFFKIKYSDIKIAIYFTFAFIVFFIFNYLLTSTPVLIYGDEFITNTRISTIPVEDFFYNFAYVNLIVGCFIFFKRSSSK